jgi:hypothetical protein
VALLFVRDLQKLEEYREYLRRFLAGRPVTVSRVFATRAEADAWLASGTARAGELVRIADEGFVVLDALKGLKFVPMRLPEELEPPPSE